MLPMPKIPSQPTSAPHARSRKNSKIPSYTVHPIAPLAAFREIRNVEPEKKPAIPRSCASAHHSVVNLAMKPAMRAGSP